LRRLFAENRVNERYGDVSPTIAPSVTSAEGSAVEKELRLGMIGSNSQCRSNPKKTIDSTN
jgi:hypothetical protein